MIRLRLFFLFIAFALLALVRPRKCLEMLEAADNWVRYEHGLKVQARMDSLLHDAETYAEERRAERERRIRPFLDFADQIPAPKIECALPPPGWRCTRAAVHEGPCAAVEVGS